MSESKARARAAARVAAQVRAALDEKTQEVGYFRLSDLPHDRDWIGELVDSTPTERIRTRFPFEVTNRFGEIAPVDRTEMNHILREKPEHEIIIAVQGGKAVGICECRAAGNPASPCLMIDVMTTGGNLLKGFVDTVRALWPGCKVGGETPAFGDVATHRLYFRYLDFLSSPNHTPDGTAAVVWRKEWGVTQNIVGPGMDSTQLAAGYALGEIGICMAFGLSFETAAWSVFEGLAETLAGTRHDTSIEKVRNLVFEAVDAAARVLSLKSKSAAGKMRPEEYIAAITSGPRHQRLRVAA